MLELTRDKRYLMRKKDELLVDLQQMLDRCIEENRGYAEAEQPKVKLLQKQYQ